MALERLDAELAALPPRRAPRRSRTSSMRSARPHYGFESLRDWFKALYETLLGSSQGPRMGSFIALYGIDTAQSDGNSRKLIAEALGPKDGLKGCAMAAEGRIVAAAMAAMTNVFMCRLLISLPGGAAAVGEGTLA
jgi:hypothetical protein